MSVFQNNTKSLPERDAQIVRVDMEQLDIGGRKSSLPEGSRSENMAIRHVPNAGGRE